MDGIFAEMARECLAVSPIGSTTTHVSLVGANLLSPFHICAVGILFSSIRPMMSMPGALIISRPAYTPTLLRCGLAARLSKRRLMGGATSTMVPFLEAHLSRDAILNVNIPSQVFAAEDALQKWFNKR